MGIRGCKLWEIVYANQPKLCCFPVLVQLMWDKYRMMRLLRFIKRGKQGCFVLLA